MSTGAFLGRIISKQLSLKRIERHCKRLPIPTNQKKDGIDPSTLRVSCVQREIRLVKNIEEYIDMLYRFTGQAADEKSRLIIFPEYNFLDLLGLIPGVRPVNRFMNWKAQRQKEGSAPEGTIKASGVPSFMTEILRNITPPIEQGLLNIISYLAERFGIYIYSGSYLIEENGSFYNTGSLFGPDGNCIGSQKKVHLLPFEERLGIKGGDVFHIFELPWGKVFLPICMDATYYETFRIAREAGVDMVVLPIANIEEYIVWKAMRGIWARVQESYTYGLKAALNGWLAGMHFTGVAGIFAPLEITDNCNGLVRVAPQYEGDYLVTGTISREALHDAGRNAQYNGDGNPLFEKRYVMQAYKKGGKHE